MKRLCVFPNDPLIMYYEKGEIKERYFNPDNIFDEIHVISFTDDETSVENVQKMAGSAKFIIHCVGKIKIKDRNKFLSKIKKLVESLNVDVIRSYNSRLEGWFAAQCSNDLNIPFFLSLHTQMDQYRKIVKKENLKKYLSLKYLEKFIEPYVIKHANKITIVYKIIEPYVIKKGGRDPELLTNRINYKQFTNAKKINSLKQPLIISIGNLIPEKNHECIIKAMKKIDADLLIIGKGESHKKLINLIKKEKVENKITIIESVPNNEIQDYYKSANVFALAYNTELEGLPIPVMEAMATGIPIVIPFQKDGFSDGLENFVLYSKREPENFQENINKILNNQELRIKLSKNAQEKAKSFDRDRIETREAEIYLELMSGKLKV